MNITQWKQRLIDSNISLSNTTINKRGGLVSRLDEFTSFTWNGKNAFDNFGAFIVTGNKGLSFNNGPKFTNSYSKPQFETAAGSLLGVNFEKRSISFTVGVYWITMQDYRRFIYWLGPYDISDLTFGYDNKYRFKCKLSKIEDSDKAVIGQEGENPVYYTEINLSFEIQGEPVALGVDPYRFSYNGLTAETKVWDESIVGDDLVYQTKIKTLDSDFVKSDLNTPFIAHMHFRLTQEGEESLSGDASLQFSINDYVCLTAGLTNLTESLATQTYAVGNNWIYDIFLEYNSETGLLLVNNGSRKILISQLTTNSSGSRIVSFLDVKKTALAGDLTMERIDWSSLIFKVTVNNQKMKLIEDSYIECYPRTNIL